ncbi:MAG: ABC transporter permease, partial [Phycisphaerales bacterium]|nr:ABC transporter permease [Phycisphaerales bacterium]
MGTLEQLLAITRNTFFESIRQPVLLVVLVICTILVVLSNPFSAYTLQDDNKMFVDIGLSTIFMGTAILSAFIASNVLTREIENRTVLTVVSKPVSRPIFVLGKYLGIAAAQTLALLFLTLAFMMVEIHGVQQTVTTPYHLPVILFGFGSMLVGAVIGIWCNYFYAWVFSSTFLVATTPLLLIAYLLCLFL